MTAVAAAPSATRPVRRRWLLGWLSAAVVLGLYADLGARYDNTWGFGAELTAPWILLPFLAARPMRHWWSAGLTGITMVVLGFLAYYGWLLFGQGVAWGTITGPGYSAPVWMVLGAFVGLVAGCLGRLSRSRVPWVRDACWGAMVAVPIVDVPLAANVSEFAGGLPVLLAVLSLVVLVVALRVRRPARLWGVVVWAIVASVLVWFAYAEISRAVLGRSAWFVW